MSTGTTGTTVIDDLANLPERIKASVERLAGLEEAIKKERQQRNELVIEYVDHAGGLPSQAARLIGKAQTQVNRILAGSSED
ncbi:hypothetical protein F9L07_19915 [Pimelobacter simplex]|uniref:Uncharacterized protein n=1 Tax=Nocardioides simplex TaxID=2045 RepID=A0A7J5DVQ9_NOCSI|nr:hypothetical protein [Pimelobacter simplex]KAB2809309.1 hypothetical protein F9L07_19915 [Pimelobacter simplex]